MDLIIEDGSGSNPNANSYSTVSELREFAAARGVTLPAQDDAVEVLAIKSMDWLESMWARYGGTRTSETQPLQYPRTGATVYGSALADNVIPLALKRAQAQATMDVFAGIDPQANYLAKPQVIKTKVDVLEKQYAQMDVTDIPYLRKAMDYLEPLFGTQAQTGFMPTFRY